MIDPLSPQLFIKSLRSFPCINNTQCLSLLTQTFYHILFRYRSHILISNSFKKLKLFLSSWT